MKIALDPGHGGIFPGAIGVNPFELREKDVMLALSLKVGKLLKQCGHQVIYTRHDDRHLDENLILDLRKRIECANSAGADIFVSLHCNAYSDPNPEGIETLYHPDSSVSEKLARAIQDSLASTFIDHVNRGVKPKDLFVLRFAQMPACQIEAEFISNPTQLEFLASPTNQENLARAIAEGIMDFGEVHSKSQQRALAHRSRPSKFHRKKA
ncbi:MAG: N-acetylmuramoyl-L-alanine amidase [candidate division KSB1 bacterium]|nr:N-acetylmuramoyl-L-alanine amidase [candidate division KSB1 bacterium]MDZ7302457.1 N-acetylmuramoyl-L-alanine amidase [candidate division KSB1 bacterium]MDZ7311949.1 N-acetylmuramoyl-L-alanine amidase [candidate division KSB1 bacterium]